MFCLTNGVVTEHVIGECVKLTPVHISLKLAITALHRM